MDNWAYGTLFPLQGGVGLNEDNRFPLLMKFTVDSEPIQWSLIGQFDILLAYGINQSNNTGLRSFHTSNNTASQSKNSAFLYRETVTNNFLQGTV